MIDPRTYAALALIAMTGCLDTPAQPTWHRDVQPILAANCVRCHGAVPRGGAPDSFRLDSYDDQPGPHGRTIRGAATMAAYMGIRVDRVGSREDGVTSMPPLFGLSDRQIDIINAWFVNGAPRGTAAEGNRPPQIALRAPLGEAVLDGVMTIRYEIADPDRDLVVGELRAGLDRDSSVRVGELHDGRGDLAWDLGVIAAGSYTLFAVLDDGSGPVETELGTYEVTHADGNVAPSVEVTTPAPYALLTDSISPVAITLRVDDPDPITTLTATIVLEHEDYDPVMVAEDLAVTNGVNVISRDTTAWPESDGWTLRTTVSDGVDARSFVTPGLVVSHRTTELRFEDPRIREVLRQKCTFCHNERDSIPGLFQDLGRYYDEATNRGRLVRRGVASRRGLIYRRIAIQRNMPPGSLALAGGELLTDAERADLIEWLLGGAPSSARFPGAELVEGAPQ